MQTIRISNLLKSVIFFIALLTSTVWAQTATAPSGSGTAIEPYLITSLENLYWIAQNSLSWDKYFEQTIDIDASATSTWSGGEGWTPIGNFSTYFTGSYDGNGFAIDGLTINRPSTNVQGLFGVISNGTITDVELTDVSITGAMDVGALSAYIVQSTITSVTTSGSVSGSSYVGGISGNVGSNSTLTSCLSLCTVYGSDNSVGGLIGRVDQSLVQQSKFSGTVTSGASGEYVGGITGFQYQGTMSQIVCEGSVTGYTYVGGIVGTSSGGTLVNCFNRAAVGNGYAIAGVAASAANSATVDKCYSTGVITGIANTAGLVFANSSSTVTASFWDTETSTKSTSNGGGTGRTTAQMKTTSTFIDAGWSNSIWYMDAGTNDGYPYLAWQNPSGSPMPVELTSFIATTKSCGVELAWSTATEVNNYGFEIEKGRMKDELGSMNWEKIGFVEGHGTTNAPKSYTFVDGSASGTVVYRLKQIDRDGSFEYSNQIEVAIAAPKEFALMQNHPNPFNPATSINYTLPVAGHVSLKIYDMLGKEVVTLVNGVQDAGIKIAKFDASQLPSGMYFYSLRTNGFSETKKMLLVK